MKKKILIPTDFSENAYNAVRYATELFKDKECEFYILNSYDNSNYDFESMADIISAQKHLDRIKIESAARLDTLLLRLKDENKYPKHFYHTESVFDSVEKSVIDFIEKKDIELVVMGTKGETNDKAVVYGRNAINLMEKVRNCPVMVIPENVSKTAVKEIVFPTSYSTHFKRKELINLIEIAESVAASIRVLHVMKEGEKLSTDQLNNQSLLADIFEGLDFSFHVVHSDDLQDAVNIFIESRGSDMVTFINKKHTFFSSIFNKAMVKELGFHSKVPILALHDLRN